MIQYNAKGFEIKGVVVIFEMLLDNFYGHFRTKQSRLP